MSLPEWDNLNTFVHDWMKGLQVLADTIAPDPGEDNSMLAFLSLPYAFDCTFYASITTTDVTDDYSGSQPWLISYRVVLMNNSLRIVNQKYVGKNVMDGIDRWGQLTDEEKAIIENEVNSMYSTRNIEVVNNYPELEMVTLGQTYGTISMYPRGHSSDGIQIKFPIKNDGYKIRNTALFGASIAQLPHENGNGYYTPDAWSADYSGIGAQNNYSVYSKIIAVFDNQTEALRVVNTISPYNTNNDVINYTKDGSEYKLYYGDNYLIYALDENKIYNYQDLFTGTKDATDGINAWHPTDPPIKTPTYDEVKREGEPDIDDDIEVEMNLNDAAFGEGLSHYYVTTVDAPVLSDISEAMSTWDINNTGKDLYRNLLSCRITKVGPIPSESSTFVIYGEELLHNGSPITITKITGNPSMDLGEYEIQPKFNDFRDYAPYTKIEMFIPYCGWVALPSHVMSSEDAPKIITGTLLCDIIAGTCKAVIKCNDTVVAEASGFTAVDVPFTGENVGMKMAGIASAITSYGNSAAKTVGNIASGGMSGGAGAGAATAGGLVGLLGSYAQLHSAFNANYTEICGKTGDGCNVAGLNKVYIKIQRPKTGGYEAPDFVPEDYGHTTGFIAMKKKQISECEGLIVCANPDTSGIGGATDRERQMIKNLLESGIIVRHTEPEP